MLKKEQLHDYQKRVIEKAQDVPNMGLMFECGLGKTVTMLSIIAELPSAPALIVAPLKIAETVWVEECKNWEHLCHLKVAKILGTPKQRLEALKSSSNIYVTNLENIVWLLEQPEARKFKYLICDESSRWKSPSTKRFKALKKHLRQFTNRYILSGTPSPQGLEDLWSQVGILDLGERLETSMTKFRSLYQDAGQRNRHTGVVYNWVMKPNAEKVIKEKISDICFALKAEDYLTLPECSKLYHNIAWEKDARVKYNELKKHMVSEIDGVEITAATAATLTNKLLQATSGSIYDEYKNPVLLHNSKLEFLTSLLEEVSAPTIVFYHFKESLKRLLEVFPHGIVLDDDAIPRWREGKIPLLFCHPMSGGIGVNLQNNTGTIAQCVWYDLPWSSEAYIQSNARVHRQGQKVPVILHHLCMENSIDNVVVKALDGKIDTQNILMESLKMPQNLH